MAIRRIVSLAIVGMLVVLVGSFTGLARIDPGYVGIKVQEASRVENEVRQAKAEAAKKVATAEGDARAAVAKAEGDARANQVLAASLSPTLLHWRSLELQQQSIARWNGTMPHVMPGTGALLYNIPAGK